MTAKEKEKNTLYITHSGEFLIWLIVILVVVSISTFIYFIKEKQVNDFNIFMSDVDGLIVGSPVRMMGIEVGHVVKIKPTKDEVYVKFVITDKTLNLPQGTVATVEFSGMAGSKSLELYLPNKNTYIQSDTPILTVNPPKRLHDALGLLNDMFDKIGSIIYTSSSFGDKVKRINIQTGGSEGIEKFLIYADDLVEDSKQKELDLRDYLKKYKKKEQQNGNT